MLVPKVSGSNLTGIAVSLSSTSTGIGTELVTKLHYHLWFNSKYE
jgi:hypothetical protein